MKHPHLLILILILAFILAACSSTPAPLPTSTPEPPAPVPPTATPADTEIPPTEAPTPTETAIPQLSAQNTFEVIAAMRAYVLFIEEWTKSDINPTEWQAVVVPLIEFGIWPLGFIFDQYTPEPLLEDQWQAAAEIYRNFLPQSEDWQESSNLSDIVDDVGPASEEMIGSAVLAAESLEVDTVQYGPDYANTIEATNTLLPEITIQPLPEPPSRGELNPALVPVQIAPFVFDYAGSEIFYTIGTIENTSAEPQQNVTIEVAFYNFLDEHIGTVRGRLLADIANPDGIYPFITTDVIAGEEAALKDQTRYESAIYSSPANAESYQAFSLTLSSIQKISGEFILSGEIANTGDQTINLSQVRIGATAFDTAGILVGAGVGEAANQGSLAQNETGLFEVVIQVMAGEPSSYQFSAEVIEE